MVMCFLVVHAVIVILTKVLILATMVIVKTGLEITHLMDYLGTATVMTKLNFGTMVEVQARTGWKESS